MVFGALLLALFWLVSPATAQIVMGVNRPETVTVGEIGECNDGVDNDGDEMIDYPDDPGCRNGTALGIERPQCQDGEDNDSDGGLIDAIDPECWSEANFQGDYLAWWDDESTRRVGGSQAIPGGWDPEGCGVVENGDVALLLPFAWLWGRRRRSRKA
jgi:hypothetical protein